MKESLAMTKEQKRRFFAHREQVLILQRRGAPHPITLYLKPNYETNASFPPNLKRHTLNDREYYFRFLHMSRKALEWVLDRQLLEADEIVKRFEVIAKKAGKGKAFRGGRSGLRKLGGRRSRGG
ncbi:MAG: hypothetical protein LQ350_005480 [Teloschistes chrysophthalmus]|nr:MAG: hypothetical protein LQ350_005480 [Niorma chrysophthalma]